MSFATFFSFLFLILLILFVILNLRLQATAEEDTSYSPVNDKEKDDPQNGTYIGLTPKADAQAWAGGKEWLETSFVHLQPSELQEGIWVFGRDTNKILHGKNV